MNARALAFAALASTAALHPTRAAAQADTAGVTVVGGGKMAEPATPRTDAPTPAVPHARRSLNTLTYEEVRTARVSDAYQLVHNLRPSWLRTPRGPASMRNNIDVAVFLNGVRMGTRDALNSIPSNSIRTVRYFTASEARLKFGGETSAGAIEVLTQ